MSLYFTVFLNRKKFVLSSPKEAGLQDTAAKISPTAPISTPFEKGL